MDKPHDPRNKQTAENVSDGNRNQITDQEIAEGEAGKIQTCLAGQFSVGRDGFCHQSGGDIVHICHAVLKAAEHEESNGKIGADDFSCAVFRGQSHQNAKADQEVTEETQDNTVSEGNRTLGSGYLHGINSELSLAQIHLAKPDTASGDQKRTCEIGQIHDDPAADHLNKSALLVQKGDPHQAVSGEKLCTHDHDHTQTKGEEEGADGFCGPDIGDTKDSGVG